MHRSRRLASVLVAGAAAAALLLVPFAAAFALAGPRDTIAAGHPDTVAVAPAIAPQAAGVVDRVVATVEDRAVMQSDVDAEYARYIAQTQRGSVPADEEKSIKHEVLNMIIANDLLEIEAEKENIKVDDREVDAALDRLIERNKTVLGGDDAFQRQLAASGLTLETFRAKYRDLVRSGLLVENLRNQKIAPTVHISDAEVLAYYKAHLDEFPKRPPTVSLAHILIVPKPSEAVLAKAREKIEMVEQKLKAGGDFAELAKGYSDCPSAKFGGSLGTVDLDDLNNPPFAEAARKTPIGQVSPPVLTEFGYHLIKIEAVEGDQVTLRHILAAAQATPEDVAAAQKLAERVRSEIVAGADFAKEAATYSDDYLTKDAGGVIGEKAFDGLSDDVKSAIKGLPAGGISPVVKETRGLGIFKVLSWNEARSYSYDEAKAELTRILEQQKMEELTNAYVEELKKSYSVIIRGEQLR
jgi:peptidyl-prolyl cis-trans isomerase SurA